MDHQLLRGLQERLQEHGPLDDIVELALDDLQLNSIPPPLYPLLQQMPNLEVLLLNDNDLTDVDRLPELSITVLNLANNL